MEALDVRRALLAGLHLRETQGKLPKVPEEVLGLFMCSQTSFRERKGSYRSACSLPTSCSRYGLALRHRFYSATPVLRRAALRSLPEIKLVLTRNTSI